MRILYFSRSYTPHDFRFLHSLARSEHDIHYLKLDSSASALEQRPVPQRVGVVDTAFPSLSDPTASIPHFVPYFKQIIQQLQPDIVHAGPVQSSAFLAALSGFRPLVTMSWGSDILVDAECHTHQRSATIYTLDRSDLLVTDCAEVTQRARTLTTNNALAVVQFPWGVDLNEFQPSQRRSLGHRSENFYFASIRAWEPQYGVMTLLRAFHLARRENPILRLILVGDGSLRGEIEQYIEQSGMSEFVHRPGRAAYTQIAKYFDKADAYVSCSYNDGASVSLLEALACGLPCLVTDRPSNREWIVAGENGWLIPWADANSLCRGLLTVAALPPERLAQISHANRSLAESRADWHQNFPKLLDAYNSITGCSQSGRNLLCQ